MSSRAAPPLPVACPTRDSTRARRLTATSSLLTVGALAMTLAPSSASAFRRSDDSRTAAQGRLQAAPGHSTRTSIDYRIDLVPAHAAAAFAALDAELGVVHGAWDPQLGVPTRLMLRGLQAPGTVADADTAEAFARDVLARHLAVLAPGSRVEDFVLVANDLDAGQRTIAFAQTVAGTELLGASIDLRFKNDRLFMVGSSAIPNARAKAPAKPTQLAAPVEAAAERWLTQDGYTRLQPAQTGAPKLVPLVAAAGRIDLHLAVPVEIATEAPIARWRVWVDTTTGEPVAREQLLRFVDATVNFSVPERGPLTPRIQLPAEHLDVTIDGVAATTDVNGIVAIPDGAAELGLGVEGTYVRVTDSSGTPTDGQLALDGSLQYVWSQENDALRDAQLVTYAYANVAKSYLRTIGSDVAWLDDQMPAVVNIDQSCNAFSDGNSINFFQASEQCENTGRIADVVMHEFGHSIHSQSIIPGVGAFEGALSEGISDYLAATYTNDSGMGRGFFFDDSALRELNPDDYEWRWPEDRGPVHAEGRIIGGTLWDLRTAMIEAIGEAEGVAYTDELWYQSIRRARDIPTMYFEALAFDDDDGNLENGTPNKCLIDAVYGAHGLYQRPVDISIPTSVDGTLDGNIEVTIGADDPNCPVGVEVKLVTRPDDDDDAETETALTLTDGKYVGALPTDLGADVLDYKIVVEYENSSTAEFPSNRADPWYEAWVGPAPTVLYCTSFETAADVEFWRTGASSGPNEWEMAAPAGLGTDPDTAFDGEKIFGTDLTSNGNYEPGSFSEPSRVWAVSDPIDVSGYEVVRLQYMRWLEIEDGYFDRASMFVNNQPVFRNFASAEENAPKIAHVDAEWRFVDHDITDEVGAEGTVEIGLELTADGGLEFGGWNLDQVCVVGFQATASSCGDGNVDEGEECDDDNTVDGDGCSATCTIETAGDDGGSDGDGGSDDGVGAGDEKLDDGCACDTRGTSPSGGAAALLLLSLVAIRRRRR